KLQTFCNIIWPTYILGPQSLPWPKEGSVNIEEIKALTDYLNTQGKLEEKLYEVEEEKSVLEEIFEDKLEEEFQPPYYPVRNNPPVPAALFPVPPPLPPSLPQSNEEATDPNKKGGELLSPSHTRRGILYGGLDWSFTASLMSPSRELLMENHLAYVHIPFIMSDLVVATHRPTVPDLHTLFAAFLGPEDKRQVLEAAEKHYKTKGATINNPPLGR
ncbi:hypothetical protein E2320_002086, partial [Naja naja]